MVSERDRIIALEKYLESLGISINIAKNKARGNKGVFIRKDNMNRIDIAKGLTEKEKLSVIAHEFAHFIHYKYDKTLKSLFFIFGDSEEAVLDELRNVTVECIPKQFAESLFKQKESVRNEIKKLILYIKEEYPDFKPSEPYKVLEKRIGLPLKYLLLYDNIRIFNKIYSINRLCEYEHNLKPNELNYIKLKSKQRLLRRINSKINRLNRYYNSPSELFARFMELLIVNPLRAEELAPTATAKFRILLKNRTATELSEFYNIYSSNLNI